MYYVMRASAPSLHRESTDSLIPTSGVLYIPTSGDLPVFYILFPSGKEIINYSHFMTISH